VGLQVGAPVKSLTTELLAWEQPLLHLSPWHLLCLSSNE
jgi:hypothetical protein